jgi:hypothetical protein
MTLPPFAVTPVPPPPTERRSYRGGAHTQRSSPSVTVVPALCRRKPPSPTAGRRGRALRRCLPPPSRGAPLGGTGRGWMVFTSPSASRRGGALRRGRRRDAGRMTLSCAMRHESGARAPPPACAMRCLTLWARASRPRWSHPNRAEAPSADSRRDRALRTGPPASSGSPPQRHRQGLDGLHQPSGLPPGGPAAGPKEGRRTQDDDSVVRHAPRVGNAGASPAWEKAPATLQRPPATAPSGVQTC